MALDIINDPNDPNKPKDQTGVSNPAPTAPPSAGTAPAQPGSGLNTTGQGVQGANPQQKTGSGFVNLQNIISANKQNQLGSTINQGMQGVAGNVRQGLQSNQDLFQQEMDKNRLGTDQDKSGRDAILNKITNYQAPAQVNTVGQGPNAQDSIISDQDAQNFQKYQSGTYQGPQSLRDIDSLREQAQMAEGLGKNISSNGGRQALLQQFVGQSPDYSRGKQALDSLLLGQTGAQDLRNARKATVGLNSEVGSTEDLAEQQATAAANQANQFGLDTKNLLGHSDPNGAGTGIIGDVYNPLYSSLNTKNAGAHQEYSDLINRLNTKSLTLDDVDKYISPLLGSNDQETRLFGLTPDQISQAFSEGKYNLSNVADPTTYAKIQALQKLSGGNPIGEALDPTQLNKPNAAINADNSRFADYRDRQQKFHQDISPLEQQQNQYRYRLDRDLDPATRDLQAKLNAINGQNFDDPNARDQAFYDTYKSALTDPRFQDPSGTGVAQTGASGALQGLLNQFTLGEDGKVARGIYDGSGPVDSMGNDVSYNSNIASVLEANARNQMNNYGRQIGDLNTNTNNTDGTGSLMDLLSPDVKQQYQALHPDSYAQYSRLADMLRGGVGNTDKNGNPTPVDPTGGYYK
jgi:hypothetical protein